MEHVFVTLQHLLKDTTVTTFIKHFDDRRIYQYNEFFLLDQDRINRLFRSNLEELASDITLNTTDFDLEAIKVVAMTIDGDFILASDSQVFVVPNTMVRADVETFDMPVIDFFVSYEEHTLSSAIIPTYEGGNLSETETKIEPPSSESTNLQKESDQEEGESSITPSIESSRIQSPEIASKTPTPPKSKPSLLARLFGKK